MSDVDVSSFCLNVSVGALEDPLEVSDFTNHKIIILIFSKVPRVSPCFRAFPLHCLGKISEFR